MYRLFFEEATFNILSVVFLTTRRNIKSRKQQKMLKEFQQALFQVSTELCLELSYDYNDLSLNLNVNYNVLLSYVKESKTRRAIHT